MKELAQMGKKVKVGKQRRDKFYRLAKEAGYRSRAAFKLIQLNKRFEFLQSSRAVVDLCAAPGGWMQVARQNMPVSSICIGVDLAPIKPIPNTIALQGDITIEKTRQAIKKELQTWEADTVLHDGAPNVGQNWIHDAFQQNLLTLSALKLATQILKRGGTFVTKVFRSNDYHFLITAFEKLFKKVHVWKPAASRLESAEIFVVCEKYMKPSKVPSELLDPKQVFLAADLEPTKPNPQKVLLTAGKKEKKAKAEGYADGEFTMHKAVSATSFIDTPSCLEILASASSIELDQEMFEKAEETTDEVRECLRDIRVCGPRELRTLIKWRKAMLAVRAEQRKKEAGEESGDDEEDMEMEGDEQDPDTAEDKELAELDEQIARASAAEKAELKKKKKRMLKEKRKVLMRRQLKMIHEGDSAEVPEEIELFSLAKIRRAKELAKVAKTTWSNEEEKRGDRMEEDIPEEYIEDEEEEEEGLGDGEWETKELEGEEEDEENEDDGNELIHTEESGMTTEEKKASRADAWFAKEGIAKLLGDEDSDEDDLAAVEKHLEGVAKKKAKKGGEEGQRELYKETVTFDDGQKNKNKKKAKKNEKEDEGWEEEKERPEASSAFDDEEDISSDEEFEDEDKRVAKRASEQKKEKLKKNGEDGEPAAKKRRLTPEQLAVGEKLIYSSKSRKELEEWGWNRFMNNDEELPDWFVDDEKKHYKKNLPVTRAQVEMYRERMRELNARPIKKVAEAKARKQRRVAVKLARAKKRAESVVENDTLEHSEKIREMKKIYKKAALKEKKEVTYQVVTKGSKGKMTRPNGQYKVVDRRMKSDNRAMKAANRKKSWKAKSTREKKDAQDKTRKRKSAMKGDRTANRRQKRGKPV